MRRAVLLALAAIILLSSMTFGLAAPEHIVAAPESDRVVYVIRAQGTITPGLASFVIRGMDRARDQGAAAILLELETLGGLVGAALDMRDAILNSPVPVYGLVRGRAWSAGALITLACSRVGMTPGSSVGSAEPRPADAKTISAVRAEFEATAEARGRNKQVAAGMVDQALSIPGIKDKGQLLNLTAARAKELGIADAIVENRQAALSEFGHGNSRVVEVSQSLAENVARIITEPGTTALLLILGVGGLIIETVQPGFGVPGVVGVLSLVVLLIGRSAARMAGVESTLLFLGGLVLLSIEAFLPGFGVAGVSGIALVVAGIIMAVRVAESMASVGISAAVAILFIVAVFRYAARRGVWSRLSMTQTLSETHSSEGAGLVQGQIGEAVTPLRPSGIAEFSGNRVSVMTTGEFISSGQSVVIESVVGNRVLVRLSSDKDANNGGARQ